jgi:hypothetical protein
MKISLLAFFVFLGCTTTHSSGLKDLRAEDEKVLASLHEEPARMGTKVVRKENGITTEIWTYSESHDGKPTTIETLIYKNDQLVSDTMKDVPSDVSFSRQFKNGKVIEATEVKGKRATSYYFTDDEKIKGSLHHATSECVLYENGEKPHFEEFAKCEKQFNTAP